MTDISTSMRDSGALSGIAEQIKSQGDADAELIHLLVARLAYFKAQARGCQAGPETMDWLQAECEIRALYQWPERRQPENDHARSDRA